MEKGESTRTPDSESGVSQSQAPDQTLTNEKPKQRYARTYVKASETFTGATRDMQGNVFQTNSEQRVKNTVRGYYGSTEDICFTKICQANRVVDTVIHRSN